MTNRQQTANIQATMGKQVRKMRTELRVTQEELAERCGMYRTYLSRIENGSANPSVQVVAELADNFDVEIGRLLTDEDAPSEDLQPSRADQRALLQFSLNWIQQSERGAASVAMAPEVRAHYQSQVCAMCRGAKLCHCDSYCGPDHNCALARASSLPMAEAT